MLPPLQVRTVAEDNGVDVTNQIKELEERAKQVGSQERASGVAGGRRWRQNRRRRGLAGAAAAPASPWGQQAIWLPAAWPSQLGCCRERSRV